MAVDGRNIYNLFSRAAEIIKVLPALQEQSLESKDLSALEW